VREFSREDERKLRIVFDNPAPGSVSAESYERSISLAASLGWHFAGENTQLTFVADEPIQSPDVYGFLSYLALAKARPGHSVLESLEVTDDYNIILTARPRGSIPSALWNSSYFLFFE
jgi:hypothetical protein